MAEWLGNGLQNRVRRFESATDLQHKRVPQQRHPFYFLSIQNLPI